MHIAGLVFAALAAAFHVVIFVWESVTWVKPATHRLFGIKRIEDAQTLKQFAFNQGFYNLFLAVTTLVGIAFTLWGDRTVGVTLVLAGTGMMFAAAVVLFASDRRMLRAAFLQGAFPLLALVFVGTAAVL